MHVKRCLALFWGVLFCVSAQAGVTTLGVSDEFDQTFQYTNATAKSVGVAGELSNWSELAMTRDGSASGHRRLSVRVHPTSAT